MKIPLCISLCAILGSAAFAVDPTPAKPADNPSAEIAGKATVTIEVNGQKVTREIDLGKAATLTINEVGSVRSTTKSPAKTAQPPAEVRTWLGVISEEPSTEARSQLPIPNGTGLLIHDVYADSPAAKAGLEKNDILVRLDDQILTNPEQLRVLTGSKKDGDIVHVTYLRKGHEATVEARLASHAEDDPVFNWINGVFSGASSTGTGTLNLNTVSTWTDLGSTSTGSGSTSRCTANPLILNYSAAFDKDGNLAFSALPNPPEAGQTGGGSVGKNGPEKTKAPAEVRTWLGVATDEPSADVRAQLPAPDGTGLLVRSVVADSPAAKAGLETNDVLVRLDDQILTNADQLRKLIGTKKDGDNVRLAYLRKGREASVEVKLQTHQEEDVGNALSKAAAWILDVQTGGLKTGGEGKLLILRDPSEPSKDKAAGNAQWSLFAGNVQADVTEQIKKLDKTLREAGLNEAAIAQTNKALAETVGEVQKALSKATAEKGDLLREVRKANDELKRAMEDARRAEEQAARKAQPAPPAEKAP